MDTLPSSILEHVVNEFAKLPGIGKRTALRFALHLLKQPKSETNNLISALSALVSDIKYCTKCHCVSDTDICQICSHPKRDNQIICVVENIQDVMAIENTQQFNGLYHVLGGIISPIDGIGIHDLHIASLLKRIDQECITEVILALPTTMEGDTTNFYLHKQLQSFEIKISTIARGIAIGDNLEYADEITLGRSIINRIPFENIFRKPNS